MSNEKAKGTDPERAAIREMLGSGHTVEEVCAKYAHIDGRVISGIAARIRQDGPRDVSGTPGAPPEVPAAPGALPVSIAPSDAAPGLTPMLNQTGAPGGFTSQYQEYLVVEKIDQPNAGVIKREMPPFGINELLDRYDPGEYKMEHYRDGKIFRTYRNVVSPLAKQARREATGTAAVIREQARVTTPQDIFMQAMDTYHRMLGGTRNDDAHARAAEAAAKVEETKAKIHLETVQTAGLIDLIKSDRARPVEKDHSLTDMMAFMEKSASQADVRFQNELSVIRERAKHDLELERAKQDNERQRIKQEAEEKIAREREFLAKMKELDDARQKLHEKTYNDMLEQIKGMKDSITEELEDKRQQHKDMMDLQTKHTDEMIKLREKSAGADKDLEVAKIIKEGIVGGLDRIGARVDMLVEGGIIKGDKTKIPPKGIVDASGNPVAQTPAADATPKKEEPKVLTAEAIKAMVNEPWFQTLQKEILRDIGKRIKFEKEPALKPHGSMIGQMFLDKMNSDPAYRVHFHYLRSRDWKEILEDIQGAIKPEDLATFGHKEGFSWFEELQRFLIGAWNASMGIS